MAGDFSFVDGNVPSTVNWNGNVRDQLVTICTSSTRPATPVTGRRIWETDTLKGYYWSGSVWVQIEDGKKYAAWTTYTPTWGSASNPQPALGDGTVAGRYRLLGKTLYCSISFLAGTSTTFGTSYWTFTLPLGLLGTGIPFGVGKGRSVDAAPSESFPVYFAYPANNTYIVYGPAAAGNLAINTVSSVSPFTWATGDNLYINMIHEVA